MNAPEAERCRYARHPYSDPTTQGCVNGRPSGAALGCDENPVRRRRRRSSNDCRSSRLPAADRVPSISPDACGSRAMRRGRRCAPCSDASGALLAVLLITGIAGVLMDVALPALFFQVLGRLRLAALGPRLGRGAGVLGIPAFGRNRGGASPWLISNWIYRQRACI